MNTPTAVAADLMTAPSVTSAAHQHLDNRKRVRRACQYCRSKRLKCTADKRPCLTCQIYGVECVSAPDASGARKQKTRAGRTARYAQPVVDNHATAIDEPLLPPRDSSRHSEERSIDGESTEIPQATGVPPDALSGAFTSPGASSLPTFEQIISDVDIDFLHGFQGFESFGSVSCNTPDEHAAVEQLLALQSPPTIGSARDPKGLVGMISGIEGLASQPASNLGVVPSGLFHWKDKGNSQFLGFTSTAAILALCVRESSDADHSLPNSESSRVILDCGPMCDEISCTDGKDVPLQQIPSATLAAQCVNAFFEDYYAFNPIIERDDIGLILERYVCHGHLAPLDQSILYLITALGACSRSTMNNSKSVNFDNLYALAWNLFPHAVAAPSVASVQILLLHVLYNVHWSKWSIAWVLCGIAVRLAQSVGLHMIPKQEFGLEQVQLKLRARLWAVALILDAHLSMSQGRPQACQNSECDAELLSSTGGLLQVPGLPWPLSEILTWRATLARIQQKLNKTFSSTVTTERRLTCLEKVDLDLMKWREGLPHEFRPEQQTILDNDAHIDIYTLHLDYFNLLQNIHWGVIKYWPGASRRDQETPRLRASESICLGACLSLVRTLNAMADGNTRARSSRSRSDHLLSAMAIIYRDILRNPTKLSARTNLEYLRVLRVCLGCMVEELPSATSLTTLIENMVRSAEELVREHSNAPTGR